MVLKRKITNASIKDFKIKDKRLNDSDIPGFHARISSTGVIRYYLYYRINGKQVNYQIGAASSLTPSQARDIAKEISGKVVSGVDVQEERKIARKEEQIRNLTLGSYLSKTYLPFLESLNPKTAKKAYNNIVSSFRNFLDHKLDEITTRDLQEWVTERRKQGVSPATITYSFNRLKAAMNRAVEWDIIESHNFNGIKLIKQDNTRIRYLNSDEEIALLATLRARDKRVREQRAYLLINSA